jgi:hypothetical protein
MSDVTKNVFTLKKAYELIVDGQWIQYDPSNDPTQLWSWGSNSLGRLGDGTIIDRSSPVQVPGTQWNDISGGICSFTSQKNGWYFMVLGK